MDLATGSVKWGGKGFGQGSLIAAGDRLIVRGDRGEVSVVRASRNALNSWPVASPSEASAGPHLRYPMDASTSGTPAATSPVST